jgi:two-component system, OmpR family, sensor kinase
VASSPPFAPFARRLTRSYVVLAVLLIFIVVATTSALAFIVYVSALNDSTTEVAKRVSDQAAAYEQQRETLTQYAPELVKASTHHIGVLVYDNDRHLVAGTAFSPPGRLARATAALFGLHPSVARVSDGRIVVVPNVSGVTGLLLQYLAVVLPIGALAVLCAWLAGRSITRRAVDPLRDVTLALRRIAGGDLTPQPLLAGNAALLDLTEAYNAVAHELSRASAQRERDELQMRQFIADAGHELRTPLTIIMGYLDVLQRGVVREPDKVDDVYETMLSESRRMRVVIDKLILLARLERGTTIRTTAVDVDALATRVAAALEPIAGPGRIVVTLPSQAAVTQADENDLYEAIKNVAENAVRYAPESRVEIGVAVNGDTVDVTVSDDGPGMDEQDVQHAFDRFYRGSARTEAEGSGLGLAIAKRAVERIGGRISLTSTPGNGTRVRMALPARKAAP